MEAGIAIEDLNERGEKDDVDDAERKSAASLATSTTYVLVVETVEFENPAEGAVPLIKELLAATKKNRKGEGNWGIRRGVAESQRRPVFTVVAVGDTDCMMERAAFRSKQNTAADCNQAGQVVDRAMDGLGAVRCCVRCEIDAARDAIKTDVEGWLKNKLWPALTQGAPGA